MNPAKNSTWTGPAIKSPVIDRASGDVALKASLFVAVSPYSGLMYVVAAANEKMPAWIDCHVKTLEFYGKIPAVIVPDNAATATLPALLVLRPAKQAYRCVQKRLLCPFLPHRHPGQPADGATP